MYNYAPILINSVTESSILHRINTAFDVIRIMGRALDVMNRIAA